MQKCYNCGKEVDDNVLICPDCGALVKRYGRPESAQPEQEADPFPRETAFDAQPRGAVWRQEDGKLKFSGYVTFWLVLCAIYLGNILLSFAVTLLVYRFRDFYFEILGQFEELAYMEEYLRQLLSIIEAEPICRMAAPARQLEIAAVNCSSLYESRSGGLRESNTCRESPGGCVPPGLSLPAKGLPGHSYIRYELFTNNLSL